MLTEQFLKYLYSFVSSTSYFYWDSVHKASFGAYIANFMAKQYSIKIGISVFMSDSTLASPFGKWETILQSKAFKIKRCQSLLDFIFIDKDHTGEFAESWLNDANTCVYCEPPLIGSHTINGTFNAGKSVDVLQ